MPPSVEKLRRSDALAKSWGDRDAERLRRRMAAAGRNDMEAKVFTQRPDAVVHWTVTGETVDELTGRITALFGYLEVNDFTAHSGFSSNQQSAPKNAGEKQLPNGHFDGVNPPSCQYCGGKVWDNRAEKRSETAPDFKCRNKDECGGAAWVKKDGNSLTWKPGNG